MTTAKSRLVSIPKSDLESLEATIETRKRPAIRQAAERSTPWIMAVENRSV